MSFSRVSFAVVSRADRAGSAVKAAAYNAAARFSHGDRAFDFTRKSAEHEAHAVLLPPGSPPDYADAATLWRAAEAAERRCDAQTARQVLISIPREVATADRLAYATAIVAPWVADGAAAQIDVHCPPAADGQPQPHAHVLLTMRRVTDAGFAAKKCRDWNQQFREADGRAERARIEERGNAWLAAHDIGARVDLRSLADRGSRRTPEPQAARAEWQRWRREGADPTAAPPSMARTLTHRARRAALADALADERRAATEIAALTEQLAALNRTPQETTTVARRPTQTLTQTRRPTPTWHLAGGGYDALTAAQQAEAQTSYRRWAARRPAGAQAHDLSDYVSYVQDRAEERPETTADEATRTPTSNGIAPASDTTARARRARHLADLLRQHYDQAWLPPSVADRLERVDLDPAARTATLRLRDGTAVVDHGDRLSAEGPLTDDAAAEIAAAAARHGWQKVTLTGNADFRDRVAMALALREPSIAADHVLPPAAQARVREALAARATAAVAPLNRSQLATLAQVDTAAAARLALDTEDRLAAAALAGRPGGETDSAVLARPREAAVTAARDTAVREAIEATAAADAYRHEHGITARLFDAAVRRRQSALDADAARLGRRAQRLDRSHDRDHARVGAAAVREAKSNKAALDDWRWSKPVRGAEATRLLVAAVRSAVDRGDTATLTVAATGDVLAAGRAAKAYEAAVATPSAGSLRVARDAAESSRWTRREALEWTRG